MKPHGFFNVALRTPLLAVSLAVSLVLAGCGGGDGDSPPPAAPPAPGTLNAATLTGRLVAPDGTTPLANALVYVEGSALPASSGREAAQALPPPEQCGTPPTAGWSYTCSAGDGSFTWEGKIPANAKLVALKGAFRIDKAVSTAGGAVALGDLAVPIGATATRMAVVTGTFDSVQDVLAKLGFGTVDGGHLVLGSETFDLYDGDESLGGTYKDSAALFQDGDSSGKPDIFNYAIVFLNCGTDDSFATDPARQQILRDYVTQGGRLYVSDLAYNFVEQTFPAYIDYEGAAGTSPDAAEPFGVAEVGLEDITSDATLDPALKSWLGSVTCGSGASCLNTDGTARIEGFLSGWAVMVGPGAAAPSDVRVWVRGPVTFGKPSTSADRPLTVGFKVGSGRVTYTSYHNEPFGAVGFVPVERILQFLVFEL